MKHTIIIRNGIVYKLMPLPSEIENSPCSHCDLYDECFSDDGMKYLKLCLDDAQTTYSWRFVEIDYDPYMPIEYLVAYSM